MNLIMTALTVGLLSCWCAAGMALGLVIVARLIHLVVYEFKRIK